MQGIAGDTPRKDEVRKMFNEISFRYDFLDHMMSFGIDHYWRWRALDFLRKDKPELILDLATGTADLAIKAAKSLKPEKVIGVDIADKMIAVGQQKVLKSKLDTIIQLQIGDAEQLDFPDNHFDALTIAFGVRNFENLEKGLGEMNRVLKEGGRAVILEFSKPHQFPVRQLYHFYFNRLVPPLGRMCARHKIAYKYLPGTVSHFPHGKEFTDILHKIGFRNIESKKLTFGICTIYSGIK